MKRDAFDWNQPEKLTNVLGDDVAKLEKQLGSGNQTSCSYSLLESAGKGNIELALLGKNLSLAIFNCTFLSPCELYINDGDRTRLNFSPELDIVMEFDKEDGIDINQPSWRLINDAKNHVTREIYSGGARVTWVTLAFTNEHLNQLFGEGLFDEYPELSALLTKPEKGSIYREFPLDHRYSQITSNMISSNLNERLHLSYLESKANELICLVIDAMLEAEIVSNTHSVMLRSRDIQAIRRARELLLSNLSQAPSIREICLMIGMNRNKLHYGFKEVFGMPVSKYLQEERLAEAYTQLEQTDQTMLQIALNVGFKHQSSFSTAFRKKYGFSPNELR